MKRRPTSRDIYPSVILGVGLLAVTGIRRCQVLESVVDELARSVRHAFGKLAAATWTRFVSRRGRGPAGLTEWLPGLARWLRRYPERQWYGRASLDESAFH